jgi:NAD(P)-dependent dehydrogenase (short-subunit alcohol dehydrogenase family)
MNTQSLSGKVVVITGASSGFGKGVALTLADERADLVLAARRGQLLSDLAAACRDAGARALAVPTDVSRPDEVKQLADAAMSEYGRIDIWINNAGVGALGPFERIPLEDHEQVIRTNLLGTLYGCYHAYRQFTVQGAGTLINVASELGAHTVPYYSSYTAAKHGVVGLGDSLRQEIDMTGRDGIHVCTVMPAAHDTPFFDHAANYTGHEIEPPKPLHDPYDVVETIVRLARDPKDKEIVGADGLVKILMKKLMPGVQEKAAATIMHRTQMEKAPPAADSPNALRAPIPSGTEVSAGRR